MQHEVRLEVFEGPLDLLLNLITRQRVDIYEVSLAAITDEYLRVISQMERLDLESATGFLVVAAALLELKSARLLPARFDPDGDRGALLEERDLLLGRLVECATYRGAGEWLRAGLAAGERFFPRDAALEPQFARLAPDFLAGVSTEALALTAARLLEPQPEAELDISHIAPATVSVRDAMLDIARVVEDAGTVGFDDLCGAASDKIGIVVRFLALLELFKAGAVDLQQAERFGDIRARWTGDVAAAAAIEETDEYAATEERR